MRPRRSGSLLIGNLGSHASVSTSASKEEAPVSSSPADPAVPTPPEAKQHLEEALFEIRRVIAGQDAMLERVLVCLLAQGHLLIEGVPGLAKTLTIKTTAGVLGGSFSRVQFTPDLVPSDLVGTRIYRPGQGAVGPARGDAGAAGHDRAHELPRSGPVPRDGDAEPDRVRRDVPAAGGADRPLHAEGADRLSGARRGAHDRATPACCGTRAAAGAVARGSASPAAGGVRRVCRSRSR